MKPKPAHLEKTYAEQFGDASVVVAYRQRPSYPEATFALLRDLLVPGEARVLDIGCGRGDLTLPLSTWAESVDAVDPSAGMIREAELRAGDAHPAVRWIEASIEDADVTGPYALATAGESLHWTQWHVALPRLADLLAPGARLAIVHRTYSEPPWHAELMETIPRYSTNQAYQPYDLVAELQSRALFQLEGRKDVPGYVHTQPVAAYIESFHSANGFSRDRMPPGAARAFDDDVRAMLRAHGVADTVELAVGAHIAYGRPRGR